jgi:hypothetical protein
VLIQLVGKPISDMVNQNLVPRLKLWWSGKSAEARAAAQRRMSWVSADGTDHAWVDAEVIKDPSEGYTASGVIQQEYVAVVCSLLLFST